MYKILASVLAILLSTQMIVPLAFAAEQSEGKAGKGSRDVGASELSGEAALGAASLTIPRTSSTASGTTVSAASVEKNATSSLAAKPDAAEAAALSAESAAQTGASASAGGSTGASASTGVSAGTSVGTSASTTEDATPSTADPAALPTASNSNAAKSAHFSLNQNTIGNDGLSTSVTITLDCSGKEGDSFVLKISKGETYGLSDLDFEKIGTLGASKLSEDSQYYYITDTLSQAGSFNQSITLSQKNNYAGQPLLKEIGEATKTVELSSGGEAIQEESFTQYIKPGINPSVKRINPTTSSAPAVIPHVNYTYEVNLGENTGVDDSTSYSSAQANSGINYGTTVIIPVPEGFQLDVEATAASNGFTDGATITQEGGAGSALVISVPKGAGAQYHQAKPGYKLVGSYEIPIPESDVNLTASGTAHVETKVNEKGDVISADFSPWTEVIRGLSSGLGAGSVKTSASGVSTSRELLLDEDESNDPGFLNTFGFDNDSVLVLKEGAELGSNPTFTIDVANGMAASSIKTPAGSGNLAGTKSFSYQVTYNDGTTAEGTIDAGASLDASEGKTIKQVILKPDQVLPGARSDNTSTNTRGNNFIVYGKVSKTYLWDDDAHKAGDAVSVGDTLTSSFSFEVEKMPNNKGEMRASVKSSAWSEQKVIGAESLKTSLSVWTYQSSRMPGVADAGKTAVTGTGNSNDTTDTIYEPIFYTVLPTGLTYNGKVEWLAGNPQVSTFWTGSGADAHQVIKADYSGTGYSFKTKTSAVNAFHLAADGDLMPGTYQIYTFVTTSTGMTNKKVTDEKQWNSEMTEGHADKTYCVGTSNWTVLQAKALMPFSVASGNLDEGHFIHAGRSDDKGSEDMAFAVNIINATANEVKGAKLAVNLPATDDGVSEFNFTLNGPISLDGTQSQQAKVYYSTEKFDLSQVSAPDTGNLLTASQVSDWSQVKAVLIDAGNMAGNTTLGRVLIEGKDATLDNDAGKTAYLSYTLYSNDLLPSRVGLKDGARIAVEGTSTVGTVLQYIDDQGVTQSIPLNFTRSYRNNKDHISAEDFPKSLNDFGADDQAKIAGILNLLGGKYEPDKDQFPSAVLDNGTKTWSSDLENKVVAFGDLARPYADGDQVVYKLIQVPQNPDEPGDKPGDGGDNPGGGDNPDGGDSGDKPGDGGDSGDGDKPGDGGDSGDNPSDGGDSHGDNPDQGTDPNDSNDPNDTHDSSTVPENNGLEAQNKAANHSEEQSNAASQKNLPQTGDGILLLVVSCVAILGIVGAAVAVFALRNKK